MTAVSYLIAIITTQRSLEVTLALQHIAGSGQAFHGFSNGTVSTDLWIIPKGKTNRQKVITQLQAIPTIQSISIVALSNPVKEMELTEVRELFAQVGWDTNSVTDEALSLFINAKLQGQYTYYIDYNPLEKAPIRIQIKPIQEHPHFSPDWLQSAVATEGEEQDREFTEDDTVIHSVVVTETIEEEIEPPPPPNKQ
jgi:hypothetical protein